MNHAGKEPFPVIMVDGKNEGEVCIAGARQNFKGVPISMVYCKNGLLVGTNSFVLPCSFVRPQ